MYNKYIPKNNPTSRPDTVPDSSVRHTTHTDRAYIDTSRRNDRRHAMPSHERISRPHTTVPTNIPPPARLPRLIVHPSSRCISSLYPPSRAAAAALSFALAAASFHSSIEFTVLPRSGLPFPRARRVAPAKRGGSPSSNENDSRAGEK